MTLDLVKLDETSNPKELLKMLTPWVDTETSRYQELHSEWEKNILFYLGKQWIEKKQGTNGYEVFEDDDGHYRPVTNYTARLAHFKRSQVLGRNIRPTVKPDSKKKADRDASLFGELVLKARYQMDREEELLSLNFLHAEIFGITWRANFKQPIPDQYIEVPLTEMRRTDQFNCKTCGNVQPDTSICGNCGDPDMDYERKDEEVMKLDPMTGLPQQKRMPVYETKVAVVDPFRMKCNPCATEEGLRYIREESIQPVEWVTRSFNVDAEGFLGEEEVKKVKKRDKIPRGLKISEEFKSSISHGHSSVHKTVSRVNPDVENDEDTTVLNKMYIAPSQNHTFGRLLIWTDTAVLYDGKPDIPNNKKLKRWHPYSIFNFYPHPLRFEGIAFIEDLIPLNKQINSLDSMIMEHLDKTAAPERVEFDNVQKNNSDQQDGVMVIEPRPELPNGGIPTYLVHPQIANEVYNMRAAKVAEMEKIANVPEVVQGLRPAGVDTYGGLQLLRDSADSSEAELYNNFYRFFRTSQQLKLALIQDCLINQDAELMDMMNQIRLNENMGNAQVTQFLGTDLRDNMNVEVEESDYLHETKGAEADRVSQLVQSQILTPENLSDPLVQLGLLRELGVYSIDLPQRADVEKMERIIQIFEQGDIPRALSSFKPYDDPNIQIRMLKDWLKSDGFVDLDPQIQQAAEMKFQQIVMAIMPPPLPPGPQGPGVPGKGPLPPSMGAKAPPPGPPLPQ